MTSRRSSLILASLCVALGALAPRPSLAQTAKAGIVTTTLYVPDGVTKMRGVIAFTGVGLGGGWPADAEFRAMAKRLQIGVVKVSGEKSAGDDASYPTRCAKGEFKMLLDSLTELGKVSNHPELANAPIIGGGHSHGGDYWNYFNACYPERMALVFCKSSGGVQYAAGALRTPMVWEIGTNDLLNNSQGAFRGGMFAHRTKGSALTLVLGPGESHGGFTAGSRQMVIEVIESIFALRVPANADPAAGPVVLNDLDESTGGYWIGDNYSKEITPWAMFSGKNALERTSFLANEEIAKKWKAYGATLPESIKVDQGVCSKCYKQLADEPALKPINPGTPPADAGVAAPEDAGAPAPPDPVAVDAAGPVTTTPPPDAGARPASKDAAPPKGPTGGSDEPERSPEAMAAAGGCSLSPDRAPPPPLWLLALVGVGTVLGRRRR